MGQLVINYPNAQAVRIYYALSEHFRIPREERDPNTGQMVARSKAAIKADVDNAIRERLKLWVSQIELRDKFKAEEASHHANYTDTGIAE